MAGKKRADEDKTVPGGAATTRVLIVDDHEVVREGLRLLINAAAGLHVCGEAANASEARLAVEQLCPDVAIVDLSLGNGSGLDLVRWIKTNHPAVRSIVASMHEENLYGLRALRAGAWGYVGKSQPARTILNAIRQVLIGELYFGKELVDSTMRRAADPAAPQTSAIELLSDRELEVFRHIGQGLTSKEIAQNLNLSASTVDTYRERLKAKLGISHSTQLAYQATRWALENP